MADNFNDMLLELFGAMDRVTASHVNKLKFDKTITAEIIDNSNKDKGEYIVSDGSSTFKAYSEKIYAPGTWVYVQIPNGDFNNQKIITGKYINNNTEYYTYTPALDTYVDITKNLIDGDQTSAGLVANGKESYITIWEQMDFPDGKSYDRLGLKGEFRTWLSSSRTVSGNYGLRLDIVGEEMNTTQTEPTYKWYSFSLDSDDFYGDVYNFETFYSQETVFDISHIPKIVSMRLVFYQDGNFKNDKGKDVAGFLDDGTELDPNIFVQSPFVSLGYNLSNFNEDKVLLYTLDSETYANYLTEDVKQDIYLESDTADSEAFDALVEHYNIESELLRTEYDKTEKEYNDAINNLSLEDPAYEDKLSALQNEYEEKLNQIKTSLEKLEQNYKQGLQAILNKVDLNNPNSINQHLNQMNAKTLQVRWIHKDENEKIICIDSKDELPEGCRVHWYRYVLEEGVADELAGPFWQEVFPQGEQDTFIYENFIPDIEQPFEQFKIIIECLSQKYVEEKLIYNDERLIELDALIESGEATEKEIQERENIFTSYYKKVNYYYSEPLTLNNESAVPDQATVSLIKGLEIVCDEAGSNGVYNIYTENGEIIAQSEAVTKRILSARYNTLITGQDIFDTAEKIVWRIPTHNTMIQMPTEGTEYSFYDQVFITKTEELIPGTHYSRTTMGEYIEVIEGEEYSAEKLYFIRNNTEIEPNEAEGYIDIIRYGVVSSREPGTEEADTTEQYFRIKPFYIQGATNNTIKCIITKNNKEYPAEYELLFGPTGVNGTNYTFTLSFDNQAPALTWDDDPAKRTGIKVYPKVLNYERQDITKQFKNFSYSWYSIGGSGLLPPSKALDDIYANINFAENIVLLDGTTREIEITDCLYYILKCSVKANVEIEEEKVDAGLKEIEESTEHETEVEETVEPVKTRQVTLTAFLPISIRRGEKWKSFNGVDKICYDLTGTNPHYYKDKCSLHFYNEEKKITEPAQDITWELKLGLNTGYSETDSQKEKTKIFKYYPKITSDGFVTVPSLFMQENGNQVAFIARSTTGDIEWVQPVRIYQDSYSSAVLNSWDGSLTIDEENGKILSAMIGAGKKDANNRFNGVLMGDVSIAGENEGSIAEGATSVEKELAQYYTGTGLYGYNEGVKSFGLNINGKAFFGKPGNGQILIDGNSGSIQSRSYIQTKKYDDKPNVNANGEVILDANGNPTFTDGHDRAGMIIDLDRGSINAYGEGSAAAVTIDPTPASSVKPIFEVKSSKGKELLFVGDKNYYLQSDDYKKETTAVKGEGLKFDLYKGTLDAYKFKLTAGTGDNKIVLDSTAGTYPLTIGTNFKVKWNGSIEASLGTIGGWQIQQTYLNTGGLTLYSSNSTSNYRIYAGNGNFSVDKNGKMKCTGATISGAITATSLTTSGNVNIGGNITMDGVTISTKRITVIDDVYFYAASDGSTAKVSYVEIDDKGKVTKLTNHTIKNPYVKTSTITFYVLSAGSSTGLGNPNVADIID